MSHSGNVLDDTTGGGSRGRSNCVGLLDWSISADLIYGTDTGMDLLIDNALLPANIYVRFLPTITASQGRTGQV